MKQVRWIVLAPQFYRITLVLGLATAWLLAGSQPAVAAEAPNWSRLEGRLKKAVLSRQFEEAKAVVTELAQSGELKGYQLIIKYALAGHDYGLERHAGGFLVGVKQPDIRREVYTTIQKSANPKTKIVLLGVVARWADDLTALDALHGVLRSARNQKEVLFSALYWIRKLRLPKRSMDTLIDELERRERSVHDRVYYDLHRTLEHLTGYSFRVAVDWRNFWEGQKKGVARPAQKKGGEGRTRLANLPSFFTVTVDSDRVLFIIDVSTSMLEEDFVVEEPEKSGDENVSGDGPTVVKRKPGEGKDGAQGPRTVKRTRISRVKKELINTVQALPKHVRFNVMSFSHEIRFLDTTLIFATSASKMKAMQWVQGLKPNGVTRTDLALQQGLEMPEVDTICLLTDGAPKNEQNQRIPPDFVHGVVKQLNRFRKCRINTIGFSQAGRSMRLFVQDLARMNDGECVLLE